MERATTRGGSAWYARVQIWRRTSLGSVKKVGRGDIGRYLVVGITMLNMREGFSLRFLVGFRFGRQYRYRGVLPDRSVGPPLLRSDARRSLEF